MSPEKKRDFEAEWPLLSRRLRFFLGRKKVPHAQRDDLIQETALRLYKMWDSVDRTRPAWALTVTIALNLLRDEYRRAGHADIVAELPEIAQPYDVEQAGLARIELKKVRAAMTEMSAEHRSALLAEIGQHDGAASISGEKMRRLRARRKLTQLMERVSAVVLFPLRRVSDLIHGLVGMKEALAQSASCVLCGVLGVGAVLAIPAPPARSATPSTAVPRLEVSVADKRAADLPDEAKLISRATRARERALSAVAAERKAAARKRAAREGRAERAQPLGVDPDDVTDRLPETNTPHNVLPEVRGRGAPRVPDPPTDQPVDPDRTVRAVTQTATKLLAP